MKTLLSLIVLVMLSGCSYVQQFGTVKDEIGTPAFQAKLQPQRELRFLILSEDSQPDQSMEKLIERTSALYEEQFGIKFKVVGYRQFDKPGTAFLPRPHAMLQSMWTATKNDTYSFDIAVTGQGIAALDFASLIVPLPTYVGLIDDRYRRYIIIRVYDKYVLAHEVAHSFVFKHGHPGCLLGAWWPFGTSCYWLPKKDWEEAMSNKFRDFSVQPVIPEEFITDNIKEE